MIDVLARGDIAILTMTHGKANALTTEFCDGLAARVRESAAARAIVITGQGRIFSAGVDLPRLLDGGPTYAREFLPALHRLYETIFFHESRSSRRSTDTRSRAVACSPAPPTCG